VVVRHDNDERLALFSAYERLDNVDYKYLTRLASNIGTARARLLFFKVHERVEHFETTEEILLEIWQKFPEKVKKAFNFIAEHQLKMWDDLYKIIN
jgi:glycerophosphoryl diester phosphodiesterase